MRLPPAKLDLATSLSEFDVWITPSLGEIRDTDKFQEELARVVKVFDAMEIATKGFATLETSSPEAIADTFVMLVQEMGNDEIFAMYEALASVLFLVTGKSDNNTKCQLPIHLRDNAKWVTLPIVRRGKLTSISLPRELKADKYMEAVVSLRNHAEQQMLLLREFCKFILSDERYVSQLWSIGRSYTMLKEFRKERDLLTPLVVFKVRGSVSASGGHGPEELLRDRMTELGLESGVDFNTTDVVVGNGDESMMPGKTRAYDFVLPFRTPGWTNRVFIQCQFYAGDSGSVSHKNVDQTSTSRASITRIIQNPVFVEYVDGAGYFSSLNGDLRSLLSMPNTKSFIQIRSAPIRLRRELQEVGFLCLVDLEHAVLGGDGKRSSVKTLLLKDGYAEKEIDRCIESAARRELLAVNGDNLAIIAARREIARKYMLLDIAALHGGAPSAPGAKLTGSLAVPGFGPFHGMKLDELAGTALKAAPALQDDWSNPQTILHDIRTLSDDGVGMSC
jgi:hypothetical protein